MENVLDKSGDELFQACFEILNDSTTFPCDDVLLKGSVFVEKYSRFNGLFGTKTQSVVVVEGMKGQVRERDVESGFVTRILFDVEQDGST
jgi:Transport and Golgi organisation 2